MIPKKIFCMCLNSHHLNNLKKLDYIPVGLGKHTYSDEWLSDNTGKNISNKNSYYGEYTFYYWLWKNLLHEIPNDTWLGFAGYRYHWAQESKIKSDEINKIVNKKNYEDFILKKIPQEWNNYEVILGEKILVNNWKLSKIWKHGKIKFIKNPKYFLKSNQNIKLHFDIFHGEGYLDKAISLLDDNERDDFKKFVTNESSFNRENIFFCRSKELMNNYFKSVFEWLERCENEFGFNLEGYSLKRIYAFLAERYLSYWFQKYSKNLSWPIFFFDTNTNKIELK
jgi:hypothetical protein